MNNEADVSGNARRGLWEFLRTAFAHASWQLVLMAALLGSARVATMVLSDLIGGEGTPLGLLYRLVPSEAAATCMLIAVLIAEQRVREGARRLAAYLPAVAIAALASGFIAAPLILGMRDFGIPMNQTYLSFGLLGTALYHSADALARGGLAALIYANRERFLASVRQLRAAELQRAQTERDLASSRLLAVQAMMQPEALVATLMEVQSLYAQDRAAADVRLAHFIEHLRSVTVAACV